MTLDESGKDGSIDACASKRCSLGGHNKVERSEKSLAVW